MLFKLTFMFQLCSCKKRWQDWYLYLDMIITWFHKMMKSHWVHRQHMAWTGPLDVKWLPLWCFFTCPKLKVSFTVCFRSSNIQRKDNSYIVYKQKTYKQLISGLITCYITSLNNSIRYHCLKPYPSSNYFIVA